MCSQHRVRSYPLLLGGSTLSGFPAKPVIFSIGPPSTAATPGPTKLNLFAYPDSADANGNLADAYSKDGQTELARKYARKVLALLDSHAAPASSWSDTPQRRSEIRKAIEDVLEKLNESSLAP